MRIPRPLAALLAAALVLTACGTDGEEVAAPSDETANGADTDATPADDGNEDAEQGQDGSPDAEGDTETTEAAMFPVTITHKHGETTIDERPERVAVVGLRDADAVIALGVTPVATREWFGEQPDAVWPWAQDELGDADPVVLDPVELDVEVIAGLEPDVIIGVDSGLTADEYALLSEVAPTVAQPEAFDDFAVPWRDRTLTVARALGEVEQAETLIADIEDQFATAAEANAEFDGATALVGLAGADGQAYAYGPEDTRSEVLVQLGFEVPDIITEQVPDDSFFVTLSQERFDELDADALVWVGGDVSAFDNVVTEPLYPERVADEGRDLFLPYDPLGGAMSFASVLSLPFLIEELVPELQLALDGDPTTTSEFGR
jgi:iron complex transport system substrate-binding protein